MIGAAPEHHEPPSIAESSAERAKRGGRAGSAAASEAGTIPIRAMRGEAPGRSPGTFSMLPWRRNRLHVAFPVTPSRIAPGGETPYAAQRAPPRHQDLPVTDRATLFEQGTSDDEPLTVTELSARLQRALERRFADVEVRGELSGLTRRSHWYFSLRDEQSVLGCVAWARTASRFDPGLKDGDEVVVRGSLTHYAPQGRTQLVVQSIRASGAGARRAQFEALCRELREKGWFAPEGKRALPLVPRRVAVITSRSGAAIHDVIATARKRCPAIGLVLLDVRVQGTGAEAAVIRALDALRERHLQEGIDVVILTRGGGSAEDLETFNHRGIAEAIRRCAVPVVAAIGHESDVTIAELVADHRASTPTQATMLVLPDAGELVESLAHQGRRLNLLVSRLVERRRARLRSIIRHPLMRAPGGAIGLARERLMRRREALMERSRQQMRSARARTERCAARLGSFRPVALLAAQKRALAGRCHALLRSVRRALPDPRSASRRRDELERVVRRAIRRQHARLAAARRTLDLTDPSAILARGFSMTTDRDGNVLRDAAGVHPGDVLITTLATGSVTSQVQATGLDPPSSSK